MRYIISCNKTSVSWDIVGHDDVTEGNVTKCCSGRILRTGMTCVDSAMPNGDTCESKRYMESVIDISR